MDLRALSIVSGRRCWILCIDALILAADGSVLDALSLAAKVDSGSLSQSVPKFPDRGSKQAQVKNKT